MTKKLDWKVVDKVEDSGRGYECIFSDGQMIATVENGFAKVGDEVALKGGDCIKHRSSDSSRSLLSHPTNNLLEFYMENFRNFTESQDPAFAKKLNTKCYKYLLPKLHRQHLPQDRHMEISKELDNSQSSDILYFLESLIEIVNTPEDRFSFYLMHGRETFNCSTHYERREQALRAAKFQALKSLITVSPHWVASCNWGSDRVLMQSDESVSFFGDCRFQQAEKSFESPLIRQELLRNLKWRPQGIETKLRLVNKSGEFLEGKDTLKLIDLGLGTFATIETLIPG